MATIVHQGIKLAFEERGVGKPAFVFVHGWSCDRSFFGPQVEYFSRQHRVVAVDLRGHGESDKPQGGYRIAAYADDTAYIIEQLGFGKVVAVGHSSGAWTVMQLAALHPEHVTAIVMVDPAPFVMTPERRASAEAMVAAMEQGDQEPRRRYIMDRMFLPTSDHRLVRRYECDAGHAGTRGRLCHAGRIRIEALPSRRNARSPRSIWRRRSPAIHRHATRRI